MARIFVTDLEACEVGGRTLIGLCDADVVLLLTDEGPDSAVLAGGEEFENPAFPFSGMYSV